MEETFLYVTTRELSSGKTFKLDSIEAQMNLNVSRKGGNAIVGSFKYFLTGSEAIFSIEYLQKEGGENESTDYSQIIAGKRPPNKHSY